MMKQSIILEKQKVFKCYHSVEIRTPTLYPPPNKNTILFNRTFNCLYIISARQHNIGLSYSALIMLLPVRLSVRLSSVTRLYQSKTVEIRIVQLSPQSSPMTLVFSNKRGVPV